MLNLANDLNLKKKKQIKKMDEFIALIMLKLGYIKRT